jgi:hypothetical protein
VGGVDAGGEQCVALQFDGLRSVGFGHSHVADKHLDPPLVTYTVDYVTASGAIPGVIRAVT